MTPGQLAQLLKQKARQLGFTLAGIALPSRSRHIEKYKKWLAAGRHAQMQYLADERAVEKRGDPRLILPECRSILVLGTPYSNPGSEKHESEHVLSGRIAAYAWGTDYHLVLPLRMQSLVSYLEGLVGHDIPNRWYTDTGPILEREWGVRAGLGWIGKNSCLINPSSGSYFLLSEILLGVELHPDESFDADRCGSCTRCIQACPTQCILPDRTLDANRCISYQTIENKSNIDTDLRPLTGNWIFGCDICQMVCPWNIRFAVETGDPVFAARDPSPELAHEIGLSPEEFNRKYKNSPVKRAKRRGFLRNVAVAAGNSGNKEILPALDKARQDTDPLIQEAASWAYQHISKTRSDR